MSAKRINRTTIEYLKYLKGELSREERYSFERDLEADPFEREAMEGMEQATVGELEEDLLSLHATLQKRLKRRRRRTYYSIAASVASLLIVGTVFLNIYNINPKSDSESIPGDETFLHEETTVQSEKPVQKEKTEEVVPAQVPVQTDETTPDEIRVQEEARVPEPVQAPEQARVTKVAPDQAKEQDRQEIVVYEEKALQAAEVVSDEARVVSDEAGVVAEDMEMVSEEAEAPPVADEVMIMEAQPRRSRKKGRALEAPAQYSTGRVSGIVVSSEDMEPLPGASIMVKGSDSGMVADMDGRFTVLTDQQVKTTVIASYVGMETSEYQLAGGAENQVVMQPDMATLNEVVVIEYDADKKAYATGAVQTVKLDKEESKYSGAEPEGGLEAFKMYIEEQIRFPAGNTISKREVVVLKFNVAKDGSISQLETLRSPGDPFTEEAIRLLKEGPSWNPAKDESGATDDVVRMRIVFKK